MLVSASALVLQERWGLIMKSNSIASDEQSLRRGKACGFLCWCRLELYDDKHVLRLLSS